jgi:hypothetical protein
MRRIGPTAPAIVLGAEEDGDARDLLGQLIGEHHAASGHGPDAHAMVPACETCGLLLEAMWALDGESLAS